MPQDRPREIRPWPIQSTREGPDLRLFRVRFDALQHPQDHRDFEATVLETPDWANIVAVTSSRQIVLVRQFRFGSREVSLEIPGGLVDPGENPLEAAQRELREETGYTGDRWTSLGCVQPNPAFHTNRCHHFLAQDVEPTDGQSLDPFEDVEVVTSPVEEVLRKVHRGEIQNSLVVTALSRVFDLRDPRVVAP